MLRREGVADEDVRIEVHAEMQYVGQSYVLPIELPHGRIEAGDLLAAAAGFHAAHERAYGFAAPAEPTEIVNLRLAAIGRIPPWVPRTLPDEPRTAEPSSIRQVYFAETDGFTADPDLRPGDVRSLDHAVRAVHRRGDGLDHRRPPRLSGRPGHVGQPDHHAVRRGGTRMKLAAMGILHETNTFSTSPTNDEAFALSTISGTHGDLLGEEVWEVYGHTGITVAGYRDADSLPGVDVVPIGFASTHPGGTWPAATFERIAGAQLERLAADGPFDGVLMAQHGAMVAEGYPDADAEFIRRVREVVGPRVPIGNVMDTHGNVTPAQVHGADITLLWRTNPHMDCRDRGLQLAKLIAQTVRGEIQPVQAVVNPPMGANILAQNTADDPMRGLLREALELTEATPGLLDQSIGEGFPYADVPGMGMALVAVADRDVTIAQKAAEEMARRTWERRQAFDPRGVSVADAVRLERGDAPGPIVLLDVGDNMGAGTPGDSTFILEGSAGAPAARATC